MIKVEKNKNTGMWRYLDTKTNLYSAKEWPTRKKAWAKANDYFDLMYKK